MQGGNIKRCQTRVAVRLDCFFVFFLFFLDSIPIQLSISKLKMHRLDASGTPPENPIKS